MKTQNGGKWINLAAIMMTWLCICGFVSAEGQNAVKLGYVKNTSKDYRSLGASGHAVFFERTNSASFIKSVQIFAGRYGEAKPPKEKFHVYVLNEKQQVLADVELPYSIVKRDDLRWYTLPMPSIETPMQFYVALAFNPHETKGIYLGLDKSVAQSHSFTGLPEEGYQAVPETYDWMIRVTLDSAPSGKNGVRRLADWKPPQTVADPFMGCTEIKFDSATSEDKQSYGGSGPAIRITLSELVSGPTPAAGYSIKGFRIYASRYGSGYDPGTTFLKSMLQDAQGEVIWQEQLPYALFDYKAKWVDIVPSQPIPVGSLTATPLTLSFNPEAQQTKGIYFHYLKNPPKSHSLAGTVERGFKEVPDREWLIRIYLMAKANDLEQAYEKAYYLETGKGDIEAAMTIYRNIAARPVDPGSSAVIQKSLVRIGVLSQKQGDQDLLQETRQ